MKYIRIEPSRLTGDITIPPSKSLAHRALICGGLSEGTSKIDNVVFSEDIKATLRGLKALGIKVEEQDNQIIIRGDSSLKAKKSGVDCGESGSTIRFLIPLSIINNNKVTFTGHGKLVKRPLDVYYNIFNKQNIKYANNNGELPLTIDGTLKPAEFSIRGDISSQFITGLMFALPLCDGNSLIKLTTPLESKGYIDLTLDILNKFGVYVENNNYNEFIIPGNQKYLSKDYCVVGDYSQAAFWLTAGIIGEKINCLNLKADSLQADKAVLNIIEDMDGCINISEDSILALPSNTKGRIVDVSQCPDIAPILAVLGSLSKGTTKIINAKRLRIKECDRLKAVASEINKLGGSVKELEDELIIEGKEYLKGGEVDSWNDHRIAMAMAIASIKCKEPVIIKNSDCVKKSYPDFWGDFKKLGGKIDEWSVGE